MAKLLSGTRIYGTANVDTSIGIGGNVVVNTSTLFVGNSTVNSTINATSITTGATGTGTGGLIANLTTVFIGNNTINTAVTSAGLTVNGTATIANSTGVYTGTVNAASHTTGATGTGTGGIIANVTTVFVGNNTINTTVTSAGLTINGTATIANSSGVYTTGTVNATSYTTGATGTGTGGVIANSSTVFVGNNTINTTANTTTLAIVNSTSNTVITTGSLAISNSSGNVQINPQLLRVSNTTANVFTVNTTSVSFGNNILVYANGSLGTANQVLTTNGTSVYWATASGGGGFTNGQSISVNNLVVTGPITANSSNGSSGQVLTSNGSAVYWSGGSSGTSTSNNVVQAKLAADQTITFGSDQVIQFVDDIDPQNWWNTSGNYRLLPNIAGYYLISVIAFWELCTTNTNQCNIQIRKNGTGISIGKRARQTAADFTVSQTTLVYLNGTTDYVDVTAYMDTANQKLLSATNGTRFTAQLVQGGGGGGANVTVSNTTPVSPTNGSLWWNTETGTMYIYYTDADSSQWAPASPALGPASSGITQGKSIIYSMVFGG